eukprot:TRINITY_DN76483_c0_g1_i1.p1 TRINITY_DN76483_c0_g1~~TRINITY_DN76483_c0_g1_i1.p1  ORF type:complete len:257 (-),score=46.80 TRINITY_DN76483_c0_g1_i1:4-774(-)
MGQTGSAQLDLIFGGCCCVDVKITETEMVVESHNATSASRIEQDSVKVLPHMILHDDMKSESRAAGKLIEPGFIEVNEDPLTIDSVDGLEEYVVEVYRPADRAFGFNFHSCDGQTLIVTEITPGSIMDQWNNTCPSNWVVNLFDRLVQINGQFGYSQELVAKLKGAGHFHLVFKRPRELEMTVSKNGKALGLLLSPTSGAGLFVQDIQAGAARDAGLNVKASDHIVAVNGRTGSAMEMMEAIKENDTLSMKVLSYR